LQRITNHHLLVISVALLLGVGTLNLFSALHLWGGGAHVRLFWMQLLWIAVGTVLGWLLSRYDYRILYRAGMRWHLGAMCFLVFVLFFGREISGHRSWLAIGGFGIQPSEFVKLSTVVVLARYFTDNVPAAGLGWRNLGWPCAVVGIPALLILLQGDLGTTLFLLLLAMSMLLFGKLQRRVMVVLVLIAIIGGGVAYQTILTPSQQGRITTFLHPEADPRGQGYQLIQAKLAVASGGIAGRGFLRGRVNKLRFLPEKHTDFVFPVLAEEWGFLGSVFTLTLFFLLLLIGCSIAYNARDRFGAFLAMGITLWLFWQVAINLGGVLGLMPLTGVTLPFCSYGGSSMLIALGAMGLLAAIERRRLLFEAS
jgi:rod shape determining protein RodA